MQVLITGLMDPDKPIQAIKAVRAVTGLGLREAKAVVDAVRDGGTATIEVAGSASALDTLTEHGVLLAALDGRTIILRALRGMPRNLTVADVLDVAEALGL